MDGGGVCDRRNEGSDDGGRRGRKRNGEMKRQQAGGWSQTLRPYRLGTVFRKYTQDNRFVLGTVHALSDRQC